MNTKEYLEFLKLEYSKIHEKRLEKSKHSFSYVTIVISLFAASFVILSSINEGDYATSFGITLSGVCVFTNFLVILALENTVRTYQIGGYLQYLETEINRAANKPTYLWESYLSNFSPLKRVSNLIILILSGFIYVFVGALPCMFFIRDLNLLDTGSKALYYIYFSFEFVSIVAVIFLIPDLCTAKKKYYQNSINVKENYGSKSSANGC